jgi:oxygen-independent coproporphyrinogen III oxidase
MSALYLHIPFCERKCAYCDFYSVTGGEAIEPFLAALCREIDLRAAAETGASRESLFFGGGTPSLLSPAQLERLFAALRRRFSIAGGAEVTLEANPGTVDTERLRAYRSLGVTRLSLGIQSFRDSELRTLGRIHDRAQALDAIRMARAAGFDNLSLDLIYAVPDQTLADWEATLDIALASQPEHVSAYSLTIEPGTPLAAAARTGAVVPAPDDLQSDMYLRTMERLAVAGYDHYEVSSYARPGFRCRHNLTYWSHGGYLGFGPAAHSFHPAADGRSGRRWWNVADLAAYLEALGDGRLPLAAEELLGMPELREERVFLGLRAGGLDLARLERELDYDLRADRPALLRQLAADGLATLRDDVLRLTPRGYLLCDEICARLVR